MFTFRALASGSSGNAYLLRTGKVALLFEAGVRLPLLRAYLATENVALEDLTAVFISHEHRDHCLAARDLAVAYRAAIHAHPEVLRAAGLHECSHATPLELGVPVLLGDVQITSFPVPHDSVRQVGFLIELGARTICIATDLGQSTSHVHDAVRAANLVVLEANHDVEMLQTGRYPAYLRKRVAGPTGHLSNTQAATILAEHVRESGTEVWLAHLSKENNTPQLAVRTVQRILKSSAAAGASVQAIRRDRPSLRWTGQLKPRQLSLFTDFGGL
ncbi:MAG: MBL fold metallo-hydrolase [Chloroflexota bacterium]